MTRHLTLVLVLLGCAACPTEATQYLSQTYACKTDVDCTSTYRCVNGVCATPTGGGGATGGGTATGGGSATGGGAADAGACDGPEVCGDELDDNCNGILDDGCGCDAGRSCYPNATGVLAPNPMSPQLRYPWDGSVGCSAGRQACTGGLLATTCTDLHVPTLDGCGDSADNDCDGVIDPSCMCRSGLPCYQGAPFTNGVGACHAGTWALACTTVPADSRCVGQDLGGVELCNGVDDDCNGAVDDLPLTTTCGQGVCAALHKVCTNGVEAACDLNAVPGYRQLEVCGDALDNNCNGIVDDGCVCVLDAGLSCFTGANGCPTDGGACAGGCQRGTERCESLVDGGLGFGACQLQVLPTIELCADDLDNDCDSLKDCADLDCNARSCGPNGVTCFQRTCQCVRNGIVNTGTESCINNLDDNCNGLIDCADTLCDGRSCGANSRICVGTTCTCAPDGGVAQTLETTCNDGVDNDCDGLKDCAASSCTGRTCAAGRLCQQGVCTCLTDGGTPQVTESSCFDGVDNDCDGQTDCADFNCRAACAEKNCRNGLDDDGDGDIDCADSDCLHQGCSTTAASAVCCAVAAGSCTDLTSPTNCGACGAVCASGTCRAVAAGGHSSAQCTCSTGVACPGSLVCRLGICDCDNRNSLCGNGQSCYELSGADFCHY